MLTADDLAGMRSTLNDSLPDSGTIYQPSFTNSNLGGTTTWVAAGTVAVRLSPVLQRIPFEGGQQGALTQTDDWWLTFPHGTDVRATYRVACLGGTFELSGVQGPRSYPLCIRVQATRRSS